MKKSVANKYRNDARDAVNSLETEGDLILDVDFQDTLKKGTLFENADGAWVKAWIRVPKHNPNAIDPRFTFHTIEWEAGSLDSRTQSGLTVIADFVGKKIHYRYTTSDDHRIVGDGESQTTIAVFGKNLYDSDSFNEDTQYFDECFFEGLPLHWRRLTDDKIKKAFADGVLNYLSDYPHFDLAKDLQ